MDRRWLLGIAALFAVVLAVVFVAASSDTPVPTSSPRPKPARTAPRANVRVQLPAPAGVEAPVMPREAPPPAQLTPDDRRQMNLAVDAVLVSARTECLVPWVDGLGGDTPVEVVFDAVLHDGRLVDVGMRAMDIDPPDAVLDCVADRAWYADWPEWDLPGELRLQRSIDVSPSRTP